MIKKRKLSNDNKTIIAKKIGANENNIAFRGLRISIKGPPKSSPIIENPPNKIYPVPNISIVQPF